MANTVGERIQTCRKKISNGREFSLKSGHIVSIGLSNKFTSLLFVLKGALCSFFFANTKLKLKIQACFVLMFTTNKYMGLNYI